MVTSPTNKRTHTHAHTHTETVILCFVSNSPQHNTFPNTQFLNIQTVPKIRTSYVPDGGSLVHNVGNLLFFLLNMVLYSVYMSG